MKRNILFSILLAVFTLLLLVISPAKAGEISVCRDTSVEWLRYRFSGIDWTLDTLHYVADGASAEGDTLIADALTKDNGDGWVFAGEAFVAYHIAGDEWFTIKGTPDTAPCGGDDNGEGWKPGVPEITIPMTADCSWIYIKNKDPRTGEWDGNWSRVEIDGEPVLLHYGESLFGGQNQSASPDDYLAVAVNCY